MTKKVPEIKIHFVKLGCKFLAEAFIIILQCISPFRPIYHRGGITNNRHRLFLMEKTEYKYSHKL